MLDSMLNSNSLFASLIWGGIGSGFFAYGWKQKSAIALATGVAMVGLSYFIDSALYMSLAEVAVLVLMYWLKKQG
jgi:hypothetical protein